MRNVLVTASAGLIGVHLCEALLAMDDCVIGVDNHLTGSPENTRWLLRRPRFRHIEGDVCDRSTFEGVGPIDAVLHFACAASPPDFERIPGEILSAGSIGTLNVAEFAQGRRARMILASTSEVYGDPLEHPQTESYWGNVNPIGPRACYDEAKRFSEAAVSSWSRTHGLDSGIVRIFNTFGPRMRPDDGRVVSNFITQAMSGRPITIYGDGSQTRSFCFVDDIVAGVLAMLDSGLPGPVNLGNPQEFTVQRLAGIVIDLTGSTSPITHLPLPEDDPVQRRPDISEARRVLEWEPRIDLRKGLELVLEYFENLPSQSGLRRERVLS